MQSSPGAAPSALAICGLPPERRTLPGLAFLRRRAIQGHRGLYERLERARVDFLTFVDVDRPSRVAFQAGIEETRRVRDLGPSGEGELHDVLVGLPGADDPIVRPDRRAHPLPLLDRRGVGFQDERPHAGQGLAAPSTSPPPSAGGPAPRWAPPCGPGSPPPIRPGPGSAGR